MPEKIVYDPKEPVTNQKNVRPKKTTEKPKPPATTKQKKAAEPRADELLHAQDGDVDTEEPVTEFRTKVNKYGFLHVPKKARLSLPFKIEKALVARIDGDHLTIAAATKSQPEEPRPSAEKT
jgi:hypothetical protein